MDILEYIGDSKSEQDGVWIDYTAEDGETAQFLIAATGNPRHTRELSRLQDKYAAEIRRGSNTIHERIGREAAAKALLLDWRGLKKGEEPFPYSAENALFLLARSIPLRTFVFDQASRSSNFAQAEEEAAKAELKSGAPVGN